MTRPKRAAGRIDDVLAEIAGLVRYDVAALVRREAFVKADAYLAAHHVRSN